MLSNFIDHKNRKALVEDIKANKERQSFQEFETKIQEILSTNSLIDLQK